MNAFSELERLFETSKPCFTVETASNLVSLGTDPDKAARIEELSAKANEGRLSFDEEQEYWSYIYAGRMMSIPETAGTVVLEAVRCLAMDRELRDHVRSRAGSRCEYCRLRQSDEVGTPFHVEHIVAQQHGGTDNEATLPWRAAGAMASKARI